MLAKNRAEGAAIRGRLQELGILLKSGHEHLRGSLVIPIFGEDGRVVQMYGRKITAGLRKGTPSHLYLPGLQRGVWNVEALEASREIILCESLIDALTFWCAGLRHVTTAYGTNGLTDDHWDAFRRQGTERMLIAFDRDEAGERAAEEVAKKLWLTLRVLSRVTPADLHHVTPLVCGHSGKSQLDDAAGGSLWGSKVCSPPSEIICCPSSGARQRGRWRLYGFGQSF